MRFPLHATSLFLAVASAAIIPAPARVPYPNPSPSPVHGRSNNTIAAAAAAAATGGSAAQRSAQVGVAPPVCWCSRCTYTCCTEAWCWDQGPCC